MTLKEQPNLFGRRLREARQLADIPQDRLGVKIGLDEHTASARMSRYETGVHEPPSGLRSNWHTHCVSRWRISIATTKNWQSCSSNGGSFPKLTGTPSLHSHNQSCQRQPTVKDSTAPD